MSDASDAGGASGPADNGNSSEDPTTHTVAWFHCFSGVAGDMALGSLIDAGADVTEVRALCERLPIGGWSLDMRISDSGGGRFSIACCADIDMSTRRNESCAVLPSSSLRRAGS